MPPVLRTKKIAHLGPAGGAVLRDFDRAYDRSGSKRLSEECPRRVRFTSTDRHQSLRLSRPAVPTAVMGRRSERQLWNIARDRLHWLDVGRHNHLAPFLGFVGDEFAEISGRAWKHRAAQIGKPCFEFWICNADIDLLVQSLDEL